MQPIHLHKPVGICRCTRACTHRHTSPGLENATYSLWFVAESLSTLMSIRSVPYNWEREEYRYLKLMPQLVLRISWQHYAKAFGCENTRNPLSTWDWRGQFLQSEIPQNNVLRGPVSSFPRKLLCSLTIELSFIIKDQKAHLYYF